tara:strand:- start:379 stop:1293 length:915 start_codon:yes stop_codon:yes gene_type:complete
MPTEWVELSVETPPEFVEPLTQVFTEHGEGGVAIDLPGGFNPDEGEEPPVAERVVVKTYIPHDATLEHRYSRIEVAHSLIAHVGDVSPLQVRVVKEEDWERAWKDHFHPLRVGRSLVVVPTWREREYDPVEGDVVIRLDPGLAFGTGHHPTTRMCLSLVEQYVHGGMHVLDVGCGSGILSIAAIKVGAVRAFGLEIDEMASEAAKRNVNDNGLAASIRIEQASLPHPDVSCEHYDVVVANISSKVIIDLSRDMVAAIKPKGRLLLSGLLDEQAISVVECLSSLGMILEEQQADADWVAMVFSSP